MQKTYNTKDRDPLQKAFSFSLLANNKFYIFYKKNTTWVNEEKVVDLKHAVPLLSAEMIHLSYKDTHFQGEKSLQDFCHSILHGRNERYFSATVICSLNKKTVGFLNMKYLDGETEIDYICTSEDLRRCKVGTNLLQILEKFCHMQLNNTGKKRIFLEVAQSNYPARCLYEKAGFQVIFIRKKYYKNGDDAFIMEREIQ